MELVVFYSTYLPGCSRALYETESTLQPLTTEEGDEFVSPAIHVAYEPTQIQTLNDVGSAQPITCSVSVANADFQSRFAGFEETTLKTEDVSEIRQSVEYKDALESVAQLLRAAVQKAQTSSTNSDCKIVFTYGGIIGFAPPNAREGDLLCQFVEDPKLLALICRGPEAESFLLVGRPVLYLAGVQAKTITTAGHR
jgi:hypothetical protein